MDFENKNEMMALHSNIANFIKAYDLELNEKELKAFIIVRGVLVDYWTHMEGE